MNTVTAHAVAASVEARIAELWKQRQRDRRDWRTAGVTWSPARIAREAELRALIRLARAGRRLANRIEQRDAVTAAKAADDRSYHDWQAAGPASGPITEDELWGGYGLDPEGASDINREGQPEFNGAFNRW
jgi:hypothetical protein